MRIHAHIHAHRDALKRKEREEGEGGEGRSRSRERARSVARGRGGKGEKGRGTPSPVTDTPSHAHAAALRYDSVTWSDCTRSLARASKSFGVKDLVRTNERINEVLLIIGESTADERWVTKRIVVTIAA